MAPRSFLQSGANPAFRKEPRRVDSVAGSSRPPDEHSLMFPRPAPIPPPHSQPPMNRRQLRARCTLELLASEENLLRAADKARRRKSRRPDVERWWLCREREINQIREPPVRNVATAGLPLFHHPRAEAPGNRRRAVRGSGGPVQRQLCLPIRRQLKLPIRSADGPPGGRWTVYMQFRTHMF